MSTVSEGVNCTFQKDCPVSVIALLLWSLSGHFCVRSRVSFAQPKAHYLDSQEQTRPVALSLMVQRDALSEKTILLLLIVIPGIEIIFLPTVRLLLTRSKVNRETQKL